MGTQNPSSAPTLISYTIQPQRPPPEPPPAARGIHNPRPAPALPPSTHPRLFPWALQPGGPPLNPWTQPAAPCPTLGDQAEAGSQDNTWETMEAFEEAEEQASSQAPTYTPANPDTAQSQPLPGGMNMDQDIPEDDSSDSSVISDSSEDSGLWDDLFDLPGSRPHPRGWMPRPLHLHKGKQPPMEADSPRAVARHYFLQEGTSPAPYSRGFHMDLLAPAHPRYAPWMSLPISLEEAQHLELTALFLVHGVVRHLPEPWGQSSSYPLIGLPTRISSQMTREASYRPWH